VVYVEDPFGNLETGDNSTVVKVALASGIGPLMGTTTASVKGGVASFSNLVDDLAETIGLEFTTSGLAPAVTAAINVSAATATKLEILAQPPAAISAGSGFGFQVAAEDPFGNLDRAFNGPVTVALGTNPGGGMLSGILTVTAESGIVNFSGLSISQPAGGYTLRVSGGSLSSATTNTINIQPVIPVVPTVIAQQVVAGYKLNKKGKPQGKPIAWDFKLQYSAAMNVTTAGLVSNYQMNSVTTKRVKKKTVTILTPVKFTESYNPSNNTVTLTVSGKNPFVKGGRITILSSGLMGVRSQAGVLLDPRYTHFSILPNAKGITRLLSS
jgi:hypothetical protein